MIHYYPEDRKEVLSAIAAANAFIGPVFVGQGLTRSNISDSYGYYIVSIETAKNGKLIVGIVSADSKFEKDWTDGNMVCTLPNGKEDPKECEATAWITISGKWKKTGAPKWWFCNKEGKKQNGCHAFFSWNGAYGYQNPSL